MSKQLTVSVLVRLRDMFSSGLGGLMRRLQAFAGGFGQRIKALGASIGKFGREVGVLGGALAAISFAAPLLQAAAFDSQLRDIAITAGKTGAAVELSVAEQQKRYQKLALEVGQRSRDLAAGGQLLVAAGMEQGLIDQLMPTIGRVATAANAAVDDVSKTAFALNDTLKINPDQMNLALAKLVTAGKLGRFEFKSMASEFPELTQQMAKMGVTGMEAVETLGAGLQVAMKGASDPRVAANNFKNFLSKMASPEARKNFEEMGVDIVGVMQDATAKGINPMEAVVQKIQKLTGVSKKEVDGIIKNAKAGGATDVQALDQVRQRIEQVTRGTKVGELFTDMQVLDFLVPMLGNLEEYKRLKGEINRSTLKVVDDDFASRMRGLDKQLERFGEIGDQVMRRVGTAFATNLSWIGDGITMLLAALDWLDQAFPGAVDTALSFAGAALLLGGALGALAPVFSILGAGFGILGAGIKAVLALIGAIFSPIGILVALLVGAAAIIITNWSTFAPFFAQLWDGIKQTFSGVVQFFSSLFSGDFAGMKAGFEAVMNGLSTQASAAWDIIKGVFKIALDGIKDIFGVDLGQLASDAGVKVGEIVSAITDKASALYDAGVAFVNSLLDGIKDTFGQVLDWAAGIPGRIVDAIGSIDLTSLFKFPELPKWLGGVSVPGKDALQAGTGAGGAIPSDGKQGFAPISPVGSKGFNPARLGAAQEQTVGGKIVVEAAPGSTVKNVQSDNPAVPMVPNRGTVVGRV